MQSTDTYLKDRVTKSTLSRHAADTQQQPLRHYTVDDEVPKMTDFCWPETTMQHDTLINFDTI
jgi:hypothetical protein